MGLLREAGAARLPVQTIRHGVVRDLLSELDGAQVGARRRILFWRALSPDNGGDICMSAFESLAPRHPDLTFDFALRANAKEVPGVEELATRHPNINVHRFPYKDGMTLSRLVAESICIVLPFRRLTVEPQLAIAESLAAGVPVVASDLCSTSELVRPGENGELVPVGEVQPVIDAIERLLADRDRTQRMGRRAAELFARDWNWERYVPQILEVYQAALNGRA
jgi:glycosyltransferase involved in cell wall biosynthesis